MNDDGPHRTATLLGVIVVLAILIGGILLTRALLHNVQVQNCILSGRKDCVPIEADR